MQTKRYEGLRGCLQRNFNLWCHVCSSKFYDQN